MFILNPGMGLRACGTNTLVFLGLAGPIPWYSALALLYNHVFYFFLQKQKIGVKLHIPLGRYVP
jgi:hypothetical protein